MACFNCLRHYQRITSLQVTSGSKKQIRCAKKGGKTKSSNHGGENFEIELLKNKMSMMMEKEKKQKSLEEEKILQRTLGEKLNNVNH